MLVGAHSDVEVEIARLRVAIEELAAASDLELNAGSKAAFRQWGLAERRELNRQLGALRESVERALARDQDAPALRAELATLLSFARTLRGDAQGLRAAFEAALRQLERERELARREHERAAAEREAAARQRDALQLRIDETARRMARDAGGECQRSVPVFTMSEGLTICSSAVCGPKRRFRYEQRWLVTLNESGDDVTVMRVYA